MKLFAILLFLVASAAGAVEVGLAGVMGSKALLVIDGGSPRAFAAGEQYNGVKVISVQGQSAILEIDGKRRSLKVGQNATSAVSSEQGGAVARLTADSAGHFFTNGQINGRSVKFVVDTGASNVSLGNSEARRLGLDLSRGTPGQTMTANGVANVILIKLDMVKVGDITLRNIDATVVQQDMPFVLLGMSFLNRTSMQREGEVMVLKQRF
ncbi:MAG: retroviral-like aspartic protease family protein [Betaproteobacteria bacterium]|nr:retroviral-like aspartic protease family protein [Betaproteobacteria bacterium]